MSKNTNIILGSGNLYIVAYTGTIPENATFETEANLLGYIQGGANITYTPTFYEAKDDSGKVCKTIVTEEEVTLKSGVLTWNKDTLAKLSSTAREVSGKLKIGGIGNYTEKKYAIRFVYSDDAITSRVTIVGNNQAGFELNFQKGAETVVDSEFHALPMDEDGTLIIYEETAKSA